MWGIDYKQRLEEAVSNDFFSYAREEGISDIFETPVLGYAKADDLRFSRLVKAGLTMHPKEIYRPGNTVIINFLPFSDDYIKNNYVLAYEKAILTSAHINGFIQKTLVDMGREVSITGMPGDWDEDIYGPEWSHKFAAYIAGMGQFGAGGCIKTEAGYYGRFNSVITELSIEPTSPPVDNENIIDHICKNSLFKGDLDITVSGELISCCPAGAIDKDGINREKCQNYCRTLGQSAPDPDACGKCYS